MATEEQEKNPLAIESQKTKKSIKNPFKNKRPAFVLGVIFLAGLLVAGAVMAGLKISDELTKEKTLQNIVIGDITITPQDVTDYANLLREEVTQSGGSYEESEDTLALKELVLNAALKKEAKDAGVTVSDEDIVRNSADSSQTEEDINESIKKFRDQSKTQITTAENVAYKNVLEDQLIIKNSLLVVQSNFDTPYHKQVTEEKIPTLYNDVLNRLNNDIAPLMRSGATAEEIAKKTDADFIKNNKTDDQLIKLYNTQGVVAIQRIDDYSPGAQVFNDLEQTDYIVGDVGQLFNTDEKLEALKNVGDTTDVFASKSGLHMIARLDSANGGTYSSWDSMLNQYIDEYVKYAGLDTNKFFASLQGLALKTADKAVLSLTNPGLEKAKAQSYTCSAHTVRYVIATWIKPIGSNGGAPGNAQANPGVRFTPQPSGCVSNPDAGDGWLDRGETGYADCMQKSPNWGSFRNTASSGNYNFKGAYVDRGGGGPWSAGAYPWNHGDNNYDPPWGPKWDVANANATSRYSNYIWFVYEPRPPIQPDEPGGRVVVDLSSSTDGSCTIYGAAFFRPQGTTGAQDRRVQVRFIGAVDWPGGGVFAGPNALRTDGSNFRNIIFPPPNPAGLFPNGAPRQIGIVGRIDLGGGDIRTNTFIQDIYPPQPFGCNPPPDYGTEASINGNCTSFNMFARDRNGTSEYRLNVYYVGAGAGPIYSERGEVGSAGLSRSLSGMNLPVAPGLNTGYYFELQVDQVGIYGNRYGPPAVASFTSPPCFVGNCTVNSITPSLPGRGDGVRDNASFTFNITINESGQRRVPAGNLAAAIRDVRTGQVWWGANNSGFANGRQTFNVQVDAVNRLTQLQVYPDYAGYFPIGGYCPLNVPNNGTTPGDPNTTIDVYQRFDLTPNANSLELRPDEESPERVVFNWGVSNSGTTVNNINISRVMDRNGTSISSPSGSYDNLGATTQADSVNVTTTASVRYCGRVTVSPATGWVGPLDSASTSMLVAEPPNNTRSAGPTCEDVADRPYVRVYGGDVGSGIGFSMNDGSCALPPSNAGIFGFMRPGSEQNTGGKSGSGGQLGIFAMGGSTIEGFTSASLRTATPNATALNGLTYSNNIGGAINTSSLSPLLGRSSTVAVSCMPDYFNETQYSDGSNLKNRTTVASAMNLNAGGVNTNQQTLYAINGASVRINAANDYNKRHTVYVDGDAIITGNIAYNNYSIAAGDFTVVPNFTLVVKGNIYINPDVTRLDGTYIAQPRDDGSRGLIYTCANNGTVPASGSGLFGSACDNQQLRVNGSFLANRVILNRILNSIRDSAFRETAANSDAAEIFTFSPEVYLSPPVFRPNSTVTSGDYEYIATLPPVL